MMPSILKISHRSFEIGVAIILVALGILVFFESLRLNPGLGDIGPEPGFFPFVLTIAMLFGVFVVLIGVVRQPDLRPFFEAREEVVDLLKVGLPIFFAVLALKWLGLYITAGLYMAFFMAWYGRFKSYWALAGGVIFPVALWLTLAKGFNIPMPHSIFYETGLLPF